MKIALIMLAAGNSRRFGSNKLLYEIEGKPMYLHVLEKLESLCRRQEKCTANAEEPWDRFPLQPELTLTVVTQYKEIENTSRSLGAKVLYNPHPEHGIASSLKIGLQANLDADAWLFTVADQPWLREKTLKELLKLFTAEKKGIACTASQGKPGNPCVFSKKYYPELLALTGDVGGKRVILSHLEDTVFYEAEYGKELVDIDRKP